MAGCPPIPAKGSDIESVRFRRGWFGKLVVQVRYKIVRPRLLGPGSPVQWVDAGVSVWRDADANNIAEVLLIANHLGLGGRDA